MNKGFSCFEVKKEKLQPLGMFLRRGSRFCGTLARNRISCRHRSPEMAETAWEILALLPSPGEPACPYLIYVRLMERTSTSWCAQFHVPPDADRGRAALTAAISRASAGETSELAASIGTHLRLEHHQKPFNVPNSIVSKPSIYPGARLMP
jgi:hypothetical protein